VCRWASEASREGAGEDGVAAEEIWEAEAEGYKKVEMIYSFHTLIKHYFLVLKYDCP
jgi:hypothetical protein